jgi:hypothetical protein
MKFIAVIAINSLLFASLSVQAKTLHVAKWGDDSTANGSSSQPYETIGAALMNAGRNDKIVVQPGIYENTTELHFMEEGIKLESVAGRHGTVIDFSGAAVDAIGIQASKVRIGKKRKGFSIRCAPGEEAIYIDESTSNVRVEYNRLTGCGGDTIDVGGTRTLVRGNWIESDGYAIYGNQCVNCLIDSNIALPGSEGFELESMKGGSVMRNILMSSWGIHVGDDSEKIKLKDNVILETVDGEVGIDVNSDSPSGALVQGNIIVDTDGEGIWMEQNLSDTNDIVVKDNLVMGSADAGILSRLDAPGDPQFRVSIDRNTLVQNFQGIQFLDNIDLKSLKNNNTYASDSEIGLETPFDLNYAKHFWGDPSGPDMDGGSDAHDALNDGGNTVTGSDAGKPNAFKAKRAAGL